MKSFALVSPTTVTDACRALGAGGQGSHVLAGGQDLLGQFKDYIVPVDTVINLKRIPNLDKITYNAKGELSIGALTTLSDLEEHPIIRERFPALAEAAASVGSRQIRNAGTIGGNLCQRPRCWYFRNEHIQCLKKGGGECYSAPDDAPNKYHAIIAGGPCHIVHPSDVAPALVALGATLAVAGPNRAPRMIPVAEFFTLPSEGSILRETVLEHGEIVTGVHVPHLAAAPRSVYIKMREKDSFDWALASAAVALTIGANGVVHEAHVVLGGVAPIPWRARAAEAALIGHGLSEAVIHAAGEAATRDAEPMSKNEFKVSMAQTAVRRACRALIAGPRHARRYTDGGDEWAA